MTTTMPSDPAVAAASIDNTTIATTVASLTEASDGYRGDGNYWGEQADARRAEANAAAAGETASERARAPGLFAAAARCAGKATGCYKAAAGFGDRASEIAGRA